jgi:diguanylate cyclase (GGDEF)-like protein
VASTSSPPAIVLSASSTRLSLSPDAEVACDPAGNISIEAAQQLHYEQMPATLESSPECHGYWIRFSLDSPSLPDGGWLLSFPNAWSHVGLFYLRDGVPVGLHSGNALPPQQRILAAADMAIPLPLRAGAQQPFYLHLVGDTSRYGESRLVDATIVRLDQWLLQRRALHFGQGIYTGIILGLALYNLILFLAIRERVYLYYVLYVISFATIWIARGDFLFQYLWPQHPVWNTEYQPYVAACAIIFSAFFVREFLATRKRSPRLDLLLRGIILVLIALSLARLVGIHTPYTVPLALIGLLVCFLYAGIGLAAQIRGYRQARFFLAAWGALLVGNVVYIFMFLRLLPMTFFTYNAAQAGSAVECVLLAFALADRVNLLKRAREEKQLEYTYELQAEVIQRTGELRDAIEKLRMASTTDPLTGLSNRRHVDAAIQPWIADLWRSRVRGTPQESQRCLVVCLADLDHFKLINDELGHAVGDEVLQAAAEILRQNVRATAILARWGGEEFLVLDHVVAHQEDLQMAERLRRSVLQHDSELIRRTGRSLSLSLGFVRFPFSERHPNLLDWDLCLALADHALYGAKRAGRNCWQGYRPNEGALDNAIQALGEEEVRRLLRVHTAEVLQLGLVEVIADIPEDVELV